MSFSLRNYLLTTLLVVSIFILGFTAHTYAQSSSGITLIPATIEPKEKLDPGATHLQNLKVTNESSQDKVFYLYKKDIQGVAAGGVPIFAEVNTEITGFEISEWISFDVDQIAVPAHQSVDVPVSVHVPDNASPGSHFGGIFISLEPPKLRETGASVGYEVASIVVINVSGDIKDDARIRSLSTDKLIYGSKNVHFIAKVENQGNILIRPRGPMTITGMFSKTPEMVSINDSLAGVFPGSVRDIAFDWKSDGLGFGKYEAVLALVYDGEDGQKTIDATATFWVFPIKIMLSVLAGFLAIFALGYIFTKYYIRRAVMRASGGRRIMNTRYRKQVGISRFAFIFVSVLTVLVIVLIIFMVLLA